MELKELQKECHEVARNKGWWSDWDRNVLEQIALMHSELSEALEEYRVDKAPAYYYIGQVNEEGIGKPEGFGVELADTVIRILDTCERYNIDLEYLMLLKLQYNRTRPFKHGNKHA